MQWYKQLETFITKLTVRWLGNVFFHLLFNVSSLTNLTNNLFFLSNLNTVTAESLNLKQQFTGQLDTVKISQQQKYMEQKKVHADAIDQEEGSAKVSIGYTHGISCNSK